MDAALDIDLDFATIEDALNLSPKPEFLLFGSGDRMVQPPVAFRREVEAAGLGIEVMDSQGCGPNMGYPCGWKSAGLSVHFYRLSKPRTLA